MSATVTAAGTAAPVAPAAPTVAAVSGSTTSLTVSWSAPANNGSAITSYDLQYRQGTSGNFTNGPQNVNGTSATLTGLAANSPYQVQVRATNAEGDSDWSASGSGTTNAVQTATAPTAPTAPTVAAGSGSSTSLAVSWSAPADNGSAITSYDLQYRQGTSGNFTDGPQNVNGTSVTLTGLAANSPYQVQVRATNAEGDSDWSASGSGTTADPPGVTVSPSELTVAEGTTVPYTVRLNSRPTGTVTVTPSSDNPAVTFSPDILTLTFTPQTWATEQTVTVTAAQDTAEATATISHAVAGEGYGSVMAPSVSVRVTVPDDDTGTGSVPGPGPDPGPDPAPDDNTDTGSRAPTSLMLAADRTPAEGGLDVTVTATLDTPAPTGGTTVTLTAAGTADGGGTDYTLSSTTIAIAEGETAGTVTITVIDDSEIEDGETIVLGAASTTPALTAPPLTLTITDNDPALPTTLTLSHDAAPAEGGGPVTVTAALDTPAPTGGTTVTLTAGGTADGGGTDYTLSSTTLTLAEGETAGTVTITVIDDSEIEDGETIVLGAESTTPALTAPPLTLTITDNDAVPMPVPALPLLGQLLLALGLAGAGAMRLVRPSRHGGAGA